MAFPKTSMTKFFAKTVCGVKITQKLICQKGIIFLVSGSDPLLFNTVTIIFYYLINIHYKKIIIVMTYDY